MRIELEPLDVERDVHLLHAWVTHPRSRFWMMQGASVDDVRREYADIVASPHHDAWLGRVDDAGGGAGPWAADSAAFLAETYDPAHSALAAVLDVRPGDLGMHVLVAPTDTPVHGFTTEAFAAVMRHCFALLGHADEPTERVVVEPDAGNTAIHALNARAGFVVEGEVELPDKRALLSTCTREQWESSELGAAVVAR
ncbi:MAG: GNAT family N-acetyltransferase [Propionibacteriales bacterium]|nr:GNAT family N-acetyltransferase [Propionibacteriales bacterium]